MFDNPIITRSVQKIRYSVGSFRAKHLSVANAFSSLSSLKSTETNTSSSTMTPIEEAVGGSQRNERQPTATILRGHNRTPSKSLLRSESAQPSTWWLTMTTRRRSRNGVSFGHSTVREYNRSLGDWWDVPNGLGLGWEYVEHPSKRIDDEAPPEMELAERGRLKNLIMGARYKIAAYRLVLRHRSASKGTIEVVGESGFGGGESLGGKTRGVGQQRRRNQRRLLAPKAPPGRSLAWEDTHRTTSRVRERLLKDFGFTPEELESSERERKLLRMEYTQWTTQNAQQKQQDQQRRQRQEGPTTKPSDLFRERFVADVRRGLPATGIECEWIAANRSEISPEE